MDDLYTLIILFGAVVAVSGFIAKWSEGKMKAKYDNKIDKLAVLVVILFRLECHNTPKCRDYLRDTNPEILSIIEGKSSISSYMNGNGKR